MQQDKHIIVLYVPSQRHCAQPPPSGTKHSSHQRPPASCPHHRTGNRSHPSSHKLLQLAAVCDPDCRQHSRFLHWNHICRRIKYGWNMMEGHWLVPGGLFLSFAWNGPGIHLVRPPFLTMKLILNPDGKSLAEGHDYWKLINEWAWLESWMCTGWLHGQLREIWRLNPYI